MSMIHSCRVAAILSLALLAVPAFTQARPGGNVLDRLESGLWELRGTGGAGLGSICLGDRYILTQPKHRAAACARDVVASDPRSVTVRYSCPGIGFGRTMIRFETPRLIQIDSQGVDRGAPFAVRAEARRTGGC